ncbi:MAG: Type secretion system protein ImpK [Gammaproteobacteria bacterium]|nr:Type secretion system protein ImpK [Gammaproteobacteria bacterium]
MSQDPPGADVPRDVTIMRPRPGRRPSAAPAQAQIPLPGASFVSFLGGGINPLVQAATPLLILAGRLRDRIRNAQAESLYSQSVQEMRSFEERARRAAVPEEDVLAARYALCSVIDEAVLNTPWGVESGWAARSLLVTFHRESFGGEKVFQLVDRVLNEPRRYLALLELLYICLSLGFEGRYRVEEGGATRLTDIRFDLFRSIQTLRGTPEADLSPQWQGVENKRREMMRMVPLWVVATACAAVLLAMFIILSAKLSNRADPLNAMLAAVGRQPLYSRAHAPVATPTVGLRELLAPQIAKGLVSVTDQPDGNSLVTIAVNDLFASGSEVVNPQYVGLINEIGSAAEKVPGRYIVTGHTDDQPLRSFRFPDNFALSRERALQVANVLKTRIHDPGRVDFVGVGSSEPRFTPASLPENRARNRRVEITHRSRG